MALYTIHCSSTAGSISIGVACVMAGSRPNSRVGEHIYVLGLRPIYNTGRRRRRTLGGCAAAHRRTREVRAHKHIYVFVLWCCALVPVLALYPVLTVLLMMLYSYQYCHTDAHEAA